MYDSAYILVVVLHVKLPAKKLVKYIFDDIVCSYFKVSIINNNYETYSKLWSVLPFFFGTGRNESSLS